MAKDTVPENAQEVETELPGADNALVVAGPTSLSSVEGFGAYDNEVLARIQSDIDATLKAIAVTEFKGATPFLGVNLALLDAFPFDMTEPSKEKIGETITVPKIMYTVADDDGVVSNVMQNLNSSRQRFITLYAGIKAGNAAARANKTLTITNVVFREMGKGQFGNKAIILTMTQDSQTLWGNA